jgi:hypothetical protein
LLVAHQAENGELDYEAYAARARKRFVTAVAGIVALLIASLYVPWGFVNAGVLTSGVAEVVSCLSGLLLIGAWRGLAMKLADPADAPPGGKRGKHLLGLLLVCGAVLGAIVLFALLAWLAGWIGGQGVGWSIALVFVLGMAAGTALLQRAIRQAL